VTSEPGYSEASFAPLTRLAESREPVEDAAAQLARRAGSGDRTAQRELFHALKPYLHATLYRVLGSNAQLDDLLQDTFIEVYRSLPSYRGDAKLSTWADRIAVRVAYRYLKRERAARHRTPVEPALSLVTGSEEEILHREGVRRLYAVLAMLKPESRIAFALFAVDGRSLREVADLTGATLVAAKSRIWRARREVMAAAGADGILARYLKGGES
jgi:RNA polymerase sigma-70 factor (ECF subfamily)